MEDPKNKTESIQWVEMASRLDDLRPFERNPRKITDTQFEKLKRSIQEDGYHARIVATRDLRVLGGHQRIRAMKDLGFDQVTVLIPDRDLTDEQFRNIMIRSNVNNGEWDMDMLSTDFDLEELRDLGVDEVMNIAPWDDEDESHAPGKSDVCCPGCGQVFPIKGNKA